MKKKSLLFTLCIMLLTVCILCNSCGAPSFEESCTELKERINKTGKFNCTYEITEANLSKVLIVTERASGDMISPEAVASLVAKDFCNYFSADFEELFGEIEEDCCIIYRVILNGKTYYNKVVWSN